MKTKRSRKLALVLLFFGACRSMSHDGGRADDDIATVQGHLTASTTLAQALEGKIVPAVSGIDYTISASTAGEPSVGDDGSASYRIPLWTPDGINGLSPSLAVEYNSEAGVGLLGPRWRLTGLSTITRCPKTRAQDGVQTWVDFLGDTFCMDGQRLIRLPGTDEFRTERESFSKIVGQKDGNGDFAMFRVYRRDGQIWHYGRTLSSRLHGNPMVFGGAPLRDVSYAYYVDKIEDRYANSILITYANVVPSATTGISKVQELEPATITWGATGETAGQRSVSFQYDPLPPEVGSVDTKHMRWVHGFGIGAAQYLRAIVVSGPDGLGASPVLKRYVFQYSSQPVTRTGTPLITGDSVLTKVSECDTKACKKTTQIEWEAGSFAYTRTAFNAPDADFTDYKGSPVTNGQSFEYAPQYRRLIAADLDADGKDDVVYRAYLSPHHSGYYDCVGWKARATKFTAGDTSGMPSLYTAVPLTALGSDPDPSCRAFLLSSTAYQSVKAPNAYAGDVTFQDLNGDGYPDILAAIGKATYDGVNNPQYVAGYHAFMSNGSTAPMTFGNPITFLDSIGQPPSLANFSGPGDATIAVGDIDGDGAPEVVRRKAGGLAPHFSAADLSGIGQVAKTETRNGYQFPYRECSNDPRCYKSVTEAYFSDGTNATEHLGVIDLDGDGTVEIIRNASTCPSGMNCGTMGQAAIVTSPTMNGRMPMAPSGGQFGEERWFADLNGDGLQDLVSIVDPSGSAGLYTAMNTGAGFGPHNSTNIFLNLQTKRAGSIMIVDFNLDGRQDVLISSGGPNIAVYLSDGAGGLTAMSSGIPPGRNDTFSLQNVAADLNGDGLPDVVNLESSGLAGYIRQGKAPMLVTAVREGTGRSIAFDYDVSSSKDAAFYTVLSSQTCATDRKRLECLNRGRWLTRSLTIGGTDIATPTVQTFTYRGGVSDKNGRGFLGFTRRDIYGPGSRHTTITYNPLPRVEKAVGVVRPYVYSFAMLPQTVRIDVDTPQGPNPHHYEIVQNQFSGGWQSNGTYLTKPYQIDSYQNDCPSTSGSTCTGSARSLGSRSDVPTFDAYGNLTKNITYFYGSNSALLRTDTDVINYKAADTANWLVSLFDPARPSTRASTTVSPAETVTRTTKLTSNDLTGVLDSIEVEPTGDVSTRLLRIFYRDSRGRVQSVNDTASVTGQTRTTDLLYEDSDGVYVSTVRKFTGPIIHARRIWRHPGLGLVVEVDDSNGLAATRGYDTFGRLLSETELSGASTTINYQAKAPPGVDLTIRPEDSSTRAIQVHLDSQGRETSRISPVDASHVLYDFESYDVFGRVGTRTVRSGPPDGPSNVLNTYTFTYDDLDRLISDCHLATENANYCATKAFDGLKVTVTDEAGRVVTNIADTLGRPSIQRAALQNGTSDATFTYGPFDVLEGMMQSDNTGHTDMTYDVLGRRITLTRTGTGTRRTSYNAFGDVVGASKQNPDGSQSESLIYGRDSLGRVTSIKNPTGAYYSLFAWDAPAASPSTPAPYAIGKLVDVTAGANTHYDYGSNGLLSKKEWATQEFGPTTPVGSEQFTYDSQGRLSTITYPSHAWSSPLALTYTYDPYTGDEASVTDNTVPSAPTTIWSVGTRNELGQITSESMKASVGPTITRATNYFLQNGWTKNATLSGSNGQSGLSYTYEADSLPSTFGMSGVGGVWTSVFGHDNLGRMTSWQPLELMTTVTFTYDGDGNLTQRSWPGETVNYGSTPTARTVAISRGGVTVANDAYQIDGWGRIVDTPAATFAYDALDRITGITEKATGRYDFFRLDGFGNRVLTALGNPFNGQGYTLLYTLGDLYEFRYSSSTGSEERCRVRAGGKLVGELTRTSDTPTRGATFYLTDNVGSVVAEASSSGTVTARSRRDPFGNVLPNAATPYLPGDPAAADPDGSGRMGFGDHARDANWGVVDMVSRFYSPRLGRFISPDKILPNAFDRREHNAFAYVGNTPAALQDPLGFCGRPEEQACTQTPLVPGSSGGGGSNPGPGDGQDPYPACGGEMCADTSKEIHPQTSNTNTVINKGNGAAMAGATSANATKTAGVNRSHGATGTWGYTFEEAAEAGLGLAAVPYDSSRRDDLDLWLEHMGELAVAGNPAFNPDRKSRNRATQEFAQEAFKAGVAPVGSMGNPLARGFLRGAATRSAPRLVSRIKESGRLVREAEATGRSVQRSVDNLTAQLANGNFNPGIGTKPIGKGIFEARARDGARVYFRQVGDGTIEILGKSSKANQRAVIDEVLRTFGD